MSSYSNSFNSNNWHLLLIAGLIAWYGLEVVIPIKVIKPLSNWGRRISCLSLFNLWISSIIKTSPSYILASSITISKSFLVLTVAFKKRYLTPKSCTIALAILVLPIPGLPYKIIENNFLFLTKFVSILSLPIKCLWPTISSILTGASFKAKGLSIIITCIYCIKKNAYCKKTNNFI